MNNSPESQCSPCVPLYPDARGLSLIELLIAMALGSIILLGLVSMASNSTQTDAEVARVARQLDNATYAMQSLKDSIQHAGFYSYFTDINEPAVVVLNDEDDDDGELFFPCQSKESELTDTDYVTETLSLAVQGYQGGALSPIPSCLNSGDYQPGTDVLVIRRFGTETVLPAAVPDAAEPKGVWVQTSVGELPIIRLAEDKADFTYLDKIDTVTPLPARRLYTEIYFISRCNRKVDATQPCTHASNANADDGNPVPTLKRLRLQTGTNNLANDFLLEPIAEGIENMQLEYGIDTSTPGTTATGLPGTPNVYRVAADAALDQTSEWADVVSVRVFLLARNRDPSAGYTDPKTYALSTAGVVPTVTVTPAGAAASFRRNLFSNTFQIVNLSDRRQTEVFD